MTEYYRPKRRIIFGVFAILLGAISLVGFPTTSYYFGLGAFGAGYGAVMIALGLTLVMKKEMVKE